MTEQQALRMTKVIRRNGTIIIKRVDNKKAIILSKPNDKGLRDVNWQKAKGSPAEPIIMEQSHLSTVAWRLWLASRTF